MGKPALAGFLVVVVMVVSAAFIVPLLVDDSTWVDRANIALAVIGIAEILITVRSIYVSVRDKRQRQRDEFAVAIDELRGLAARPVLLWSGLSIQPPDRFPIPWSYEGSYVASERSPITLLGRKNYYSLAQYLTKPQRSVVVLGRSGSGKTTLAEAVQSISAQTLNDKYPYIALYLHLGSWNARTVTLFDWATKQLPLDAARAGTGLNIPPIVLRRVLQEGPITLLLDGVDELSVKTQEYALKRITQEASRPVVILSQLNTFSLPSALPDLACDVVRIDPLPTISVASIIEATPFSKPISKPLVDAICASNESALATVLQRPLYLALARHLISKGDFPLTLLSSNIDSSTIEATLLEAEIDASLAGGPPAPPKFSDKTKTRHWLATIARIQEKSGREDLVWWDLAYAAPWWIMSTLAALIVWGLVRAVELATSAMFRIDGASNSDGETALIFAFFVLVAMASRGGHRRSTDHVPWYQSGAMRGAGAAFVGGVLMTMSEEGPFAARIAIGALLGGGVLLIGLLARSITRDFIGEPNSRIRLWWQALGFLKEDPRPRSPRVLGWSNHWKKWVVASVMGVLVGFGSVGLVLLQGGISAFSADWVKIILIALRNMAIFTLFVGVALCFGKSLALDLPRSLRSSILSNLLFGATSAFMWFLVIVCFDVLLISALAVGSDRALLPESASLWDFPVWQIIVGMTIVIMAFFILIGLVGTVFTLSGRALLSLAWFGSKRALPWKVLSLLEWGHAQGLLKRRGFAYSFRHAEVRRLLAQP